MLKKKEIPHVQGCLENEKRIEILESIVLTNDNIATATALSKGAVHGTVNLAAELAILLHRVNILETITLPEFKAKINELITKYG